MNRPGGRPPGPVGGPEDGHTALILASMYGHSDVVELLLLMDADIDVEDKASYSSKIVYMRTRRR